MVSSISGFSAVSYLDQVKGVSKATPVTPQVTTPTTKDTASPTQSNPSSPLQSGSNLQLSSAVLSILQDTQSTTGNNTLANLFGKSKTNNTSSLLGDTQSSQQDVLSSLFSGANNSSGDGLSNLLQDTASKTAPLQEAVNATLQAQANTKSQTSPVQDLLTSLHSGLNAYNKVLLQNAQNTINASNTKPIVA